VTLLEMEIEAFFVAADAIFFIMMMTTTLCKYDGVWLWCYNGGDGRVLALETTVGRAGWR
jgi:hypothetical protein